MPKTASRPYPRSLFYFLFAVSGFCGLIYESIWSHYLKLFLGHAAYAQTLVLAIFMGGMAVGSWLASRYSTRWKNLLLAYAVIEGVIGVYALLFHGLFVNATDLAYTSVIPGLGSPWTVDLFKWSLAGGLILPQSILLGATFPLMSAGLIRRFPADPGASLAMLYFTNSIGAAIGVLISGFVLTELVGLPGTIFTAGLLNIVLALSIWLLVKNAREKLSANASRRTSPAKTGSWRLLLVASFVTGAASFMYEIGWIRMLNLVLGTSTHAFELMLSAFIFGLAFGGLWVRRYIDGLKDPLRFLGGVQITMGLFALGTLLAYNTSFDVMLAMMRSLARTSSGYQLFNVASHTIALGIMLPATFCAGMTLPLITHALMRGQHGEKSIGATYAANTLGAIAGIFFAVHVGLPVAGIKGLITIGAALDMALGVVLLHTALSSRSWITPAAAAFAGAVIIAVTVGLELDRYKMASGVYRVGELYKADTVEVLFHRDGKTATVDLLKYPDGAISIRTNGKSDAMISSAEDSAISGDESTMTLVAAIPLTLHPQARTAANIGFGSGLTTHVLLASPNLEYLDTIEIEPLMIEGARGFGSRVDRAFHDPRSRIHIDDAKTFFANRRSKYDIIISEPSNPWVSGVAGLFSDEFYRRVRSHLNPNGIFVQWIQLYEIDVGLVASVMKAVNRNFSDYAVYAANDGDLIIAARGDGQLLPPNLNVLSQPLLAKELRRIDIHTPQDFELRRLGDRALFEPLFSAFPIPMNSDFYPVLDLNAARSRFLSSNASELTALGALPLPVLEMLGRPSFVAQRTQVTPNGEFARSRARHSAASVRDFYTLGALPEMGQDALDPNLARHLVITLQSARDCRDPRATSLWLDSVYQIANATFSQLRPHETESVWRHWRSSTCYARLSPAQKESVELFRAVGQRNAVNIATIAERLLMNSERLSIEQNNYLIGAAMLGHLAQNQPREALRVWSTYGDAHNKPSLMLQLLWAHSAQRAKGLGRAA